MCASRRAPVATVFTAAQPECQLSQESDYFTDEEAANARLIAAAPELLAALETIGAQCGDFAVVEPALDYATIGNIARAAIAKATGATVHPSPFTLQPSHA